MVALSGGDMLFPNYFVEDFLALLV